MTTNATAPESPTLDLYREVHKGIRHSLFALCEAAGSLDPDDHCAREAFVAKFAELDQLLTTHHEHEDFGPLAALIAHAASDCMDELNEAHVATSGALERLRQAVIELGSGTSFARFYDQLVGFTADYLDHMSFEEHEVMPRLADHSSSEDLFDIQTGIRSTILPQEMGVFMRAMLPAMNSDERAMMLGGMKAGAPPDVFDLFWAVAKESLDSDQLAIVATRIGQ